MLRRFFIIASALVVALVAGFVLRKNHIIPYEEAVATYSTANSHFMDWKGVKLHYTDQGEGVPIMLLHGYAGSFDNWKMLVEIFPQDQYRLIVPDLPGLGLSQFPNLEADVDFHELYTDFTTHVINELELDSLYIVGNSLGGLLAWETAIRNDDKVKKLVLLNAAGYSIDDIGAFFIKFSQSDAFKVIIKKGAPKFIAKKAAKGCLGDKTRLDPERVHAFYGMINKEGTLQTIGKLGASGQYPDSTDIAAINIPTLIIWGDQDGIIPVEHAYKFHRDIPNSKLLIYEGSGHVPMLEDAEKLMQDMLSFFEGRSLRAIKE
ncbi:MAG: alpha/beta hydrolase [Bacteroidetes bacterium]|nr:alpha/beta hydrolase [Bacteroidota bacterium]